MAMTAQLVGRAVALNALERLLSEPGARLVTLCGPGGIGKTRLAFAVAEHHPRACVVDLAAVADPKLVLTAIANALGLPDVRQETIVDALRDEPKLLVLDNFEHVRSAATDIVHLLEAAPLVRILVTSRARLRVRGEREVPVRPLTEHDARALFAERGHAARAGFAVTDANAPAVASICNRLDGIPLAIELAAARIKVLSAEQIADRLSVCFRVLGGGDDDRPLRHRTLRATLDWSFDMLGDAARVLLRRLSVFLGGASIEAVEAVCADDADILDALGHLVDDSLILVGEDAGAVRFRLLEPVRLYALERLRDSGEEPRLRERHAAWCLGLARQAEPALREADQRVWLERLQCELANLRVAIAWYLDQRQAHDAQSLSSALWKFCEVRGHAAEGERWLATALSLGGDDAPLRSAALHGAANLAFVQGEYDRAIERHEENLVLRREIGDRLGAAITLFHLASVMRNRGEAARSLELCRASLALFRQLDEPRWCANALNSLGMALLDGGAFGAAREALEEALAIYRRLGGGRGVAVALGNLADIDRFEADYDRADARLRQSLHMFDELADAWGSSATLESLGLVACARGVAERAAILFGAADAQRAEAGAALPPADLSAHDDALARLRLQLGSGDLETALARGRAMSRSAALAFARAATGAVPPVATRQSGRLAHLTERERTVAALVARGLSNRQIADELVFTKHTADKHVTNILGKLDLASRAQLAVWWIAHAGQSSYF
jgi:non-specific serine/threonine protein kinase